MSDKVRYGYLPNKLYRAKFDPRFLYSGDDYTYKGVRDAKDNDTGKYEPIGSRNYILESMISIPGMIEIYKKGGDVVLLNPIDVGEVYFIIEDYLNEPYDERLKAEAMRKAKQWAEPHLDDRINLLDKFSQEMYNRNKMMVERYRNTNRKNIQPISSYFARFKDITRQDIADRKNNESNILGRDIDKLKRITVYNKGV